MAAARSLFFVTNAQPRFRLLAALGSTIIVQCAFTPGVHNCDCGKDLRLEPWFAAVHGWSPKGYCQACSLSFWGFTKADMVVSAIADGKTAHLTPARSALPLSSRTPKDDMSALGPEPLATPGVGLSDPGFSFGIMPELLEGRATSP